MSPLRRAVTVAVAVLSGLSHGLYVNGSVVAPCDSVLYCQGPILQAIELASPFEDSKTYVDMPTTKPLDEVVAAFNKLRRPITNNTELNDFLKTYYAPAGGELEAVPESELKADPVFLDKLNDTVIKEFVAKVISIWPDLTRRYKGAGNENCTGCQSSFIPVNRTFVVAGGRFREPYYWDSFWIVEGLLRTGGAFIDITRNTIENFLDFIDTIGFIPNGARKYYLNRSQPPLLSQMVRLYVEHTNDTGILARAVPLLIKEHDFFVNNRSVTFRGQDGKSYTLQQYHVHNTQPRPESFREDYITANNASYYSSSGKVYPEPRPLNESERADLYSNLASGAESGWDYGTRYLARPGDAARDDYFPLRSLSVNHVVPVDLNSILYWNEVTIAHFLNVSGNASGAAAWVRLAEKRSEAMTATMWNSTLWSYFDFNLTSSAQNIYVPRDADALAVETTTAPDGQMVLFHVAQLYPFWTGAAPAALKNNPLAVKQAFSRVAAYLDVRKGGIPATNFRTGQQWDQPNVWPPLMHVVMEGLRNTPATFGADDPAYRDVQGLALRIAQRYLDSTFCTWWATGGSTSLTPQLQGVGDGAKGTMFEKYADNSTNLGGTGGEYEVVEGFGWTNGVLIWAVDTFGDQLTRPDCGNITAAHVTQAKRAVELAPRDAQFVKRFQRL